MGWTFKLALKELRQSEWDEIMKWDSQVRPFAFIRVKVVGGSTGGRGGRTGRARLPAHVPYPCTVDSHELYSSIAFLITFSKVNDQQGHRYQSDLSIINCFISNSCKLCCYQQSSASPVNISQTICSVSVVRFVKTRNSCQFGKFCQVCHFLVITRKWLLPFLSNLSFLSNLFVSSVNNRQLSQQLPAQSTIVSSVNTSTRLYAVN